MALLFPREEDKDFAATTDAATRSLSAISLETSFVEGVYEKMASVHTPGPVYSIMSFFGA